MRAQHLRIFHQTHRLPLPQGCSARLQCRKRRHPPPATAAGAIAMELAVWVDGGGACCQRSRRRHAGSSSTDRGTRHSCWPLARHRRDYENRR
uniref:Uncharacterized protein n=1 Tax=Leersia perrieri TaxID=77586 RepID=A0A0D9XYV9_9ORYZ